MRRGDLVDRALDAVAHGLEPRDRAWVQELGYGTLRLRGRLDAVLRPHLKRGLGALDDDVLDALRLGAYQLLEMDSVPPYAAISQSVELVRAAGAPRAAGLVNAVLQSLLRSPPAAPARVATLDALVEWESHPRWLVERWAARWGLDATRALLQANNTRPELFVRPLGVDAVAAAALLAEGGVEAAPLERFPDSLRIAPPAGVLDALALVPAAVQDPASALVVRYADVPAGATVLDLCAAPGGKALALAERAGLVAAGDLSLRRVRRVGENVARTGAANVRLVVCDARMPPFRPADAVLIDAPCTGTGTFRRHPDGRWRIGPDDLAALAALQAAILEGAAACVRPGGLLVYSTCSLEPEENELQIQAFLARRPEFSLEPPAAVIDDAFLRDGMLVVLPQESGVDGSFAARLRRRA